MYQKPWSIILLILTIGALVGCGPKPRVEIYMEPVEGQKNAQVDAQTGSITVEHKGVQITLEPLDEVELFHLTKDPRINPYIAVGRWGNIEPLYTVFRVHAYNKSNRRVVIDQTAQLIDAQGEQYGSLPYDYFRDLYRNAQPQTTVFYDFSYRYYYPYPRSYYYSPYRHYFRPYYYPFSYRYPYPPYRVYHAYPDPYAINSALMVARESVFDGGKLFQGAKRTGLLVFERLDVGATDVKVLIPQVLITDEKGKRSKRDFEFDFRQIVNVKE